MRRPKMRYEIDLVSTDLEELYLHKSNRELATILKKRNRPKFLRSSRDWREKQKTKTEEKAS